MTSLIIYALLAGHPEVSVVAEAQFIAHHHVGDAVIYDGEVIEWDGVN